MNIGLKNESRAILGGIMPKERDSERGGKRERDKQRSRHNEGKETNRMTSKTGKK